MSRSHPPSLRTRVARALREEALAPRGSRILCAVSGGPDSTALLHCLAMLRPRLGFELVAHGVDHGLRPEARAELDLVEALSAELGVPFSRSSVSVEKGPDLMARARRARLLALAEAADAAGARRIATGHTADDRAETFLIRLLRGAGPKGLSVLPPRAGWPLPRPEEAPPLELVRPLLDARRRDVMAHLARHGLAFAEDPSNARTEFLRVRIRKEVLPLLEELSPTIVEHLGALAGMLAAPAASVQLVPSVPPEAGVDPDCLGRAQRLAIERARRLGRKSLRIRARGGKELLVTFPDGKIVLKPFA